MKTKGKRNLNQNNNDQDESKGKDSKDNRTNQRNKRTNNRNSTRRRDKREVPSSNKGFNDSTDNDASWYMRYPELANDASKIPFTTPLGKYPKIGVNAENSNVTFGKEAFSVPGIMTVNWFPTIGQSTQENSPINVVSREVYSFIRHANSGHSNYDAPDLMMYILAMDSLYSFYASMVRAYGVMMLYSGMNRYMPRVLVESFGFDFDDLSMNLTQFRWLINQVAYKLTAMYVPSGMSYFERHIWMNSGVYLDSSSYKAQTYAFVQDAYYKYSAVAANNYVAKLEYTPVPEKLTVSKCADFVNSLLNPILADEDMNIISGDMLRAFGAENLFTVSPISEDYVVVPSYSQEVLSQIQNLTIMGEPDTKKSTGVGEKADIIQRIKVDNFTPGIYQELAFTKYGGINLNANRVVANCMYYTTFDKFVTMLSDNPSSDEIMVASRLTNIANIFGIETYTTGNDTTGQTYHLQAAYGCDSLSTEVVIKMMIYTMDSDNKLVSRSVNQYWLNGESDCEELSEISAFDWHPTVYIMDKDSNNEKGTVAKGMLLETNNFTTLDISDLGRLHETALISEFYIPDVRKLAGKPTK